MSLSPAILDALLASGASAETIVAAVKAAMAEDEARKARQIPWEKLRAMAFERDGEVCGYCGATDGPFEVDHITPVIHGGENLLENVVVSCRSCNRAKRDRQGSDWEVLQERRRRDRERKRQQRAGQKQIVHGQSGQSADPPNDIYSNPPVNIPQPAKAGLPPKSKSSRAAVLPSDWQPVLTPAAQRIVDGWPPGRLETEVAKFRDYAADKGRTSRDWQAAFRTWLTNSEKWNPTNGTNRTASASIDRRDGFERAIDDWAGLDPFGNSQPASRTERSPACGGGSDGKGAVAGVVALRPDSIRGHHSDDARRIADARNG